MTSRRVLPHLPETEAATTRYLQALTVLSDEAVRAPSLLPDWTRAHVIAHLSRNADAMHNLVVWARTDVETPMYASMEQRTADIDSTAALTLDDLRGDAENSSVRLQRAMADLDPAHWDSLVRGGASNQPFPAQEIVWRRRMEVEIHHADLGVGYTTHHWPTDFALAVIGQAQDDRADGPAAVISSTDVDGLWKFGLVGQGPEIRGTVADLAWWALGRGAGRGLVSSAGPVPDLGKWR